MKRNVFYLFVDLSKYQQLFVANSTESILVAVVVV